MATLNTETQHLQIKKHTTLNAAQFRVSALDEGNCSLASFNRRDFYKVSLILKGCSRLLYADRGIDIDRPALIFTNPMVPYSWESDTVHEGFFCVFTEAFLSSGDARFQSLQDLSLYKAGGDPVYLLDDNHAIYIRSLFLRMREEIDSEYAHKSALLRNLLNLVIHEAIKMQPANTFALPSNAAARITLLFTGLLEKQFPVDRDLHSLQLKKAGEFAEKLSIHVNHLNAAVQETTGRSTTMHINEKILNEAKLLLMHTDWTVAEIAYSLGFDYPSYFTNFFKKNAGVNPMMIRKNVRINDRT